MWQERNANVLIVDDVPENLDLLCQALEPEGYNILVAPNGEVALKIATQIQPALILLDIMMPGIDGFEVCRRLKTNPVTADVPVIFITAHTETKKMVEGFQAGGVDYITKPFQHEEVRIRVRNHLTIKFLQDGLRDANAKLEKAYQQLEADNARKTEELEHARTIQEGFLPLNVPRLPYLEIAAFHNPATEVGGDYYDFFLEPGESSEPSPGFADESKLLVAIGDATGHGVGASLMVAATKMALLTVDESDLTKRVSRINRLLRQVKRNRRLNMALALFEVSPDVRSQTVHVKAAGGGMPFCYILRADGSVEEIVIVGMPLGAMDNVKYRFVEFNLQESDVLVLMSDGLPERLNESDEIFGIERLMAEIQKVGKTTQTPSEILESLVKAGDDWSNGIPQNDDVTLLVLKVNPMT